MVLVLPHVHSDITEMMPLEDVYHVTLLVDLVLVHLKLNVLLVPLQITNLELLVSQNVQLVNMKPVIVIALQVTIVVVVNLVTTIVPLVLDLINAVVNLVMLVSMPNKELLSVVNLLVQSDNTKMMPLENVPLVMLDVVPVLVLVGIKVTVPLVILHMP